MSENNGFSRREFLNMVGKGAVGAAGLHVLGIPGFQKAFAEALAHVPVVWMQAGSCSGCSVSLLNAVSPTIQDVLLDEVVPGQHLSLAFHPTVMAGQGHGAMSVVEKYKKNGGPFVLVLEGSISTKDDGIYCEVGEKDGHGITMYQHLLDLAPKAMAVINIGSCSSYGGIPMADPNPTGVKPVGTILQEHSIKTPVVNVPGCPPHPDWFIGTVATVLLGGLDALAVDQYGRPKAFYSGKIHDNCQYRGQYDQGILARDFGEEGCLYALGCRGPSSSADCPHRKWNNAVSWCIGSGSPCIGCVEPGFPFEKSLLVQLDRDAPSPGDVPPIVSQRNSGTVAGITGVAGLAAGAAAGVGLANSRKGNGEKKDAETETES
ncbi:hydrogenase small subunit [bacterium]|nr:hydrogenase small subunit [bacterium]